jgi:hypothetical protein
MSAHTSTFKGKRVLVKLKDRTKIVDKFIDSTSRYIILDKAGRVEKETVKAMTIYREPQYRWKKTQHFDEEQAKAFPNLCPIQTWVHGTGTLHNGQAADYVTCGQPLCPNGHCEEHGKVRFRPREKEEDENKAEPTLRYSPPRRRGTSRTRPRRAFYMA